VPGVHAGGEAMSDEYVSFGEVARRRCHEQCQYLSRHVGGRHGWADLSAGLWFIGDTIDYHSLKIHRDDVEEFVRRVEAYRATRQ
jgi:hypothetical protein